MQAREFVSEATALSALPFAEADTILDLLIFKASRLPSLKQTNQDPTFKALVLLFKVAVQMALQGNSLHPATVVDLAVKAKLCIETYPHFVYRLEPLIDLLIDKDAGKPKAGHNRFTAADSETVVRCERDRQDGAVEHIYKEAHKLENYRQEVCSNPEFRVDWLNIKKSFSVSKY